MSDIDISVGVSTKGALQELEKLNTGLREMAEISSQVDKSTARLAKSVGSFRSALQQKSVTSMTSNLKRLESRLANTDKAFASMGKNITSMTKRLDSWSKKLVTTVERLDSTKDALKDIKSSFRTTANAAKKLSESTTILNNSLRSSSNIASRATSDGQKVVAGREAATNSTIKLTAATKKLIDMASPELAVQNKLAKSVRELSKQYLDGAISKETFSKAVKLAREEANSLGDKLTKAANKQSELTEKVSKTTNTFTKYTKEQIKAAKSADMITALTMQASTEIGRLGNNIDKSNGKALLLQQTLSNLGRSVSQYLNSTTAAAKAVEAEAAAEERLAAKLNTTNAAISNRNRLLDAAKQHKVNKGKFEDEVATSTKEDISGRQKRYAEIQTELGVLTRMLEKYRATLKGASTQTVNDAIAIKALTSRIKDLKGAQDSLVGTINKEKSTRKGLSSEISRTNSERKKEIQLMGAARSEHSNVKVLLSDQVGLYRFLGRGIALYATSLASVDLVGVNIEMQALRYSLDAVYQSSIKGAEAFNMLRGVGDDLGFTVFDLSKSFKQFTASTQGTALEGKSSEAIFKSFTQASRALNLSVDDSEGVFRALSQMISKSKVQAEELRGQLSERLPGAFQLSAKAMNITTAELNKMLENGQVMAEEMLPKLGAEMLRAFPVTGNQIGSMSAEIGRMKSAFQDLGVAIGESGLNDAIISVVRGMTNAVKSLTAEVGPLGKTLKYLGDNLDLVTSSLGILASSFFFIKGAKAFKWIGEGIASTKLFSKAISKLTGKTVGLSAATGEAGAGLSSLAEGAAASTKNTNVLLRVGSKLVNFLKMIPSLSWAAAGAMVLGFSAEGINNWLIRTSDGFKKFRMNSAETFDKASAYAGTFVDDLVDIYDSLTSSQFAEALKRLPSELSSAFDGILESISVWIETAFNNLKKTASDFFSDLRTQIENSSIGGIYNALVDQTSQAISGGIQLSKDAASSVGGFFSSLYDDAIDLTSKGIEFVDKATGLSQNLSDTADFIGITEATRRVVDNHIELDGKLAGIDSKYEDMRSDMASVQAEAEKLNMSTGQYLEYLKKEEATKNRVAAVERDRLEIIKQLESQSKIATANVTVGIIDDVSKDMRDIEAKISPATNALNAFQKKLDKVKESYKTLSDRFKGENGFTSFAAGIEEQKAQIDLLGKEHEKAVEELNKFTNSLKSAGEYTDEDKARLAELQNQVYSTSNAHANAIKKLEELNKAYKEGTALLMSYDQFLANSEEIINNLKMDQLAEQVNKVSVKYKDLFDNIRGMSEISTLESVNKQTDKILSSVSSGAIQMQESIRALEQYKAKVKDINSTYNKAKAEVAKYTKELEKLKKEQKQLSNASGTKEYKQLANAINVAETRLEKANETLERTADVSERTHTAIDILQRRIDTFGFGESFDKDLAIITKTKEAIDKYGSAIDSAVYAQVILIEDNEEIAASLARQAKAVKQAKDAMEEYAAQNRSVADIFSDVWDKSFDGVIKDFDDFKDRFLNVFDDLATEIANQQIFTPLKNNLKEILTGTAATPEGKIQGALSAVANGVAGDKTGGKAGNVVEGISSALEGGAEKVGEKISSSFADGSFSFGKMFETVSSKFGGLFDNLKGLFTGGGGAGVAGLGAGIGSLGAMFGGEYSGIGSSLGTLVGTAIGGPIGAAIGGLAGGALGKVFGGKESDKTQSVQLDLSSGSITQGGLTGDKFSQENRDAADEAGQHLMELMKAVEKESGKALTGIIDLAVGSRDGIDLIIDGVTVLNNVGTIDEALTAATSYMIKQSGILGDSLEALGKEGEDLADTFIRLSSQMTAVNTAGDLLGGIFDLSGVQGKEAQLTQADSIMSSFESVEQFLSAVSQFDQAFVTGVDRLNRDFGVAKKSVTKEFSDLGDAVNINVSDVLEMSREEFGDWFNQVSQTIGKDKLKDLFDVSAAFEPYISAVEEANQAYKDGTYTLSEIADDIPLDNLAESLKDTEVNVISLIKSLQGLGEDVGSNIVDLQYQVDGLSDLERAQAEFNRIANLLGGDLTGDLDTLSTSLVENAKDMATAIDKVGSEYIKAIEDTQKAYESAINSLNSMIDDSLSFIDGISDTVNSPELLTSTQQGQDLIYQQGLLDDLVSSLSELEGVNALGEMTAEQQIDNYKEQLSLLNKIKGKVESVYKLQAAKIEKEYSTKIDLANEELSTLKDRYEKQKGLEAEYADLQSQYLEAQRNAYLESQNLVTEATKKSASEMADAWASATDTISGFLDNVLLGDLSTLKGSQKVAESGSQYQELLSRAKAGDAEAAQQLSGAAETYLQQARNQFASGQQYTDIFNRVMAEVGSVQAQAAGMEKQNRVSAAQEQAQAIADKMAEVMAQMDSLTSNQLLESINTQEAIIQSLKDEQVAKLDELKTSTVEQLIGLAEKASTLNDLMANDVAEYQKSMQQLEQDAQVARESTLAAMMDLQEAIQEASEAEMEAQSLEFETLRANNTENTANIVSSIESLRQNVLVNSSVADNPNIV